METKIGKIAKHLYKNGNITSLEAFRKYNATRLSGIIWELKKNNWCIVSYKEKGHARYFVARKTEDGDEVVFRKDQNIDFDKYIKGGDDVVLKDGTIRKVFKVSNLLFKMKRIEVIDDGIVCLPVKQVEGIIFNKKHLY